ncbi:MAG: DnaJ domain-containing protein [Marinilabiliaceae bacterium]|nr:DnaJ domain-containing protein [Marinilabiliaceae bacterium]
MILISLLQKGDIANMRYDYGGLRQQFKVALLQLVACMMKADGRVRKVELDYVKSELVRIFGAEETKEALLILRNLLKRDVNINDVSYFIRRYLSPSYRRTILSILYGIAMADGIMSREEWNLLQKITVSIGLDLYDLEAIRRVYGNYGYTGNYGNRENNNSSSFNTTNNQSTESLYDILGLKPTATNDEIKKTYRTLVKKFHPDTVANLGDDVKKEAERKFVRIQQAYEKICQLRNIK